MSRKTGAVPARKKSKMKTSNWQFWAIIALPVIYAIVFAYIPMGGIVIAFKDTVSVKEFSEAIGSD